jgi:predicted nucleic acid-binding protein
VIVVDTNILVSLWLSADSGDIAERLLLVDHGWSAPLLWRSEFRNVLVGYVRRRALSLPKAVQIIMSAEDQMRNREFSVTSEAVIARAIASGCTAYDCEFVVLAEQLDVPLVTNDKQVVSAFPDLAVPPLQFLERHA